jgi:hypothetical protein
MPWDSGKPPSVSNVVRPAPLPLGKVPYARGLSRAGQTVPHTRAAAAKARNAGAMAKRRSGSAGASSAISPRLSNSLAGPEIDQMNLAAVQTQHGVERIRIVARRLLDEEALHS